MRFLAVGKKELNTTFFRRLGTTPSFHDTITQNVGELFEEARLSQMKEAYHSLSKKTSKGAKHTAWWQHTILDAIFFGISSLSFNSKSIRSTKDRPFKNEVV